MAKDLVRRLRRDFLDVDSAGRARHEHRALRRAVDDDADVRFARDVGGGSHQNFLYWKIP